MKYRPSGCLPTSVMVAMRDGVELATGAWIPAVTPAPALLVRLPYGKDLPQLLAYGLMPNIFAWLVRQPWCDGNIGSYGPISLLHGISSYVQFRHPP
jgi:predicted acyl esterase